MQFCYKIEILKSPFNFVLGCISMLFCVFLNVQLWCHWVVLTWVIVSVFLSHVCSWVYMFAFLDFVQLFVLLAKCLECSFDKTIQFPAFFIFVARFAFSYLCFCVLIFLFSYLHVCVQCPALVLNLAQVLSCWGLSSTRYSLEAPAVCPPDWLWFN